MPESIGCNQNADTKNRKPVDARSSIIAMAPIDSRGEWSCSSSSASGAFDATTSADSENEAYSANANSSPE